MKAGKEDGMQDFDTEIERLLRANIISLETALSYC
jgi:Tfp pilus assembly ATPase PilU